MALQPDHAHAAGTSPHPALLAGGHRGPDGVVQRELARGGEKKRSEKEVVLYPSEFITSCVFVVDQMVRK